jgi:hypothetical protein
VVLVESADDPLAPAEQLPIAIEQAAIKKAIVTVENVLFMKSILGVKKENIKQSCLYKLPNFGNSKNFSCIDKLE